MSRSISALTPPNPALQRTSRKRLAAELYVRQLVNAVDISRLDDSAALALAKTLAGNIRQSLPKELYAGSFTLRSKLPFKAMSFREVLIHRISDLADVAIDMYELNRPVPAFVATRAVVETAAMMYWLKQKTTEFLGSNEEVAFDQFLMKGMLGSRNGTTRYESHNVLTAVDHLDKAIPGFRERYDTLCEFVHPNWSGAMGSYSKLDAEAHTLRLGREHAAPPLIFGLGPLVASLGVFQDYYNAFGQSILVLHNHNESGRFESV